jgi:carbamoyl-phosphate synthase large subunit
LKALRILVTGVASDIGFGIGKILRENYPNSFLLGVDIDSNNQSLVGFDHFKKIDHADSDEYKKNLIHLVKSMEIDIIIPTSEAEINVFWKKKLVNIFERNNVDVLILSHKIVDISLDKFKTYEFLKNNKLEYPNTYLASDFKKQECFPMIFKLRSGQGSKGLRVLYSFSDLKTSEMNDTNIIQELLSDNDNEYTCCVFSDGKTYRSINIKRQLKDGDTCSGEVVESEKIDSYIVKISKLLKLKGSINIQLRVTNRGPVLFEINPRFSGTVGFRDKLGFKDLLWSMQLKLEGEVEKYTKPKKGTKIFRGVEEYIIKM